MNTDLTYDVDFITGTMQWGEALYTVYGYNKAEAANSSEWWSDHIHPEDAMILNQAMDKLTDPSATEWTVIYRFRRADNVYVQVRDHATIIRNQNGEAIRLTGALHIEAQ